MILQVALDLTDIEQAISIAEKAAKGGAHWLEVGTPLIKKEGMRAVELLKRRFPDRKIVADLKTMDTGALEVEMAARHGADVVSILGVADDKTIKDAVDVARRYGIRIMVDLIGVKDKVKRAKELEKMGVHYILVHTGIDEQVQGKSPMEDLEKVVKAVSVPVAVAGGLNLETIPKVIELGATIIIVGGAITKAKDPEDVTRKIIDLFWGEYMMTIRKAMTDILEHINQVAESIKLEQVRGFVDAMIGANKIFIYGAGRSGLVGKAFAMRLMHLDFNVYVVGETITPAFEPGDLLIAISGSGETKSIVDAAEIAKRQGGKVVAITSYANSTLGKLSDVVVEIPGRTKADIPTDYIARQMLTKYKWIAPMGTLFEDSTMIFLDGIIALLMATFQKTEKDMKKKHATLE
ncbi:bifunctional D-arabino 3-hexulose-6-phosphate formaldehyde lyase/phosphohexuloisomerase [Thermococcus onnurineus NA1]|uniref:3-hexulose-6-phosphate synthase n=1 Tax=Thermococcus onnurineus (strain NA1) TaxID=523850 RepID=B6YTD4_THEON|nr:MULTISPECIES: bifunctional 3-hexulose-6-phosphate synthase/6-phospho-3-hexuloisomerase [Thermococcus]ACJ15821.1 bifunctional D-arabino 3-hexulose-6-phosphate formaldehyde lyase/phosphohexuloisomerase [Thermococcus onnurineus NA1]NJE42462.1 3-hexulose-6-phosphate synthase [Thermococcus sp. GR6]NJE46318.1 3-hexulose-6-phosphate synthase [Thermococcus sp. GR7]NJE79301.1 3-hexulose-6-phosphate synthase [Thermococcus sp. GR4]NJF23803.1 3-hexulose-6-phosphate synthase [Thermococcus sp. GR5]